MATEYAACGGTPRVDGAVQASAAARPADAVDAAASRSEPARIVTVDAGASATPPSAKPPRPRSGAIDVVAARIAPATCSQTGLSLEVEASTRTSCERPGQCAVPVPIRVINCTTQSFTPRTLALRSTRASLAFATYGSDPGMQLERAQFETLTGGPSDLRVPLDGALAIPPNRRLEGVSVALGAAEKWELELFAESAQTPGSFSSARATTVVEDQTLIAALERARQARAAEAAKCRAKGGNFEIVGGLSASEQCVFPFADAGKLCHDQADCRGECLLTRVVPLPTGNARLDGKCSRLPTTFGCHARIGHTANRSGVVSANRVPPSLCVD